MEKKEFYRQLRGLVLPIAFQQFMLAAVSASDAVMLGLLSQDIMAAISLAGQVQFVFSLYLATMTIGASMFAAQYWGKGDRESVERIFGMVMRFTVPVIGGIFCAGGDSRFGFLCDAVTLWVITIPLGLLAGFVWKLPVIAVYFILNLDEIIKLPAVYLHFRKYKWVRDLTQEGGTAK